MHLFGGQTGRQGGRQAGRQAGSSLCRVLGCPVRWAKGRYFYHTKITIDSRKYGSICTPPSFPPARHQTLQSSTTRSSVHTVVLVQEAEEESVIPSVDDLLVSPPQNKSTVTPGAKQESNRLREHAYRA